MMKKLISLFVSMLMFLSLCIPVTAINAETVLNPDLSTENTEMYVIHENETNQHIDDLFALRCKLALDFNKNEDAILQIDNQLAELGVEYITQSEFLNTLGYDVLPAAEVGEGDGNTQWTSRRLVSTYRGQHYELQIIEGVPKNGDSILRRSDVSIPITEQQITAGTTEIIKTLGIIAMGVTPIPELVEAATFLDTIITIGDTVATTISPSTIITAVDSVSFLSFSTHMKIILVKPYQAADKSQKWMYTGNYVTYQVSDIWEIDSPMGEHGSVGQHAHMTYTNTVSSVYFDDYSIALQNYYNYKANVDFTNDYGIRFIDLFVFGNEQRHEVPYSTGSIWIPHY